jgi:hypothetical protein
MSTPLLAGKFLLKYQADLCKNIHLSLFIVLLFFVDSMMNGYGSSFW